MRWIAYLSLCMSSLCAGFPQIYFLEEMKEDLKKADETTLVVFDVDAVLITTEDGFMHANHAEIVQMLTKQFERRASGSSLEKKKKLEEKKSLAWLLPKRVLIEENTPALIRDLQLKGVKVIALTALTPGAFGVIPKLEKWRIDHLHSLDVFFKSSFPFLDRFSFTELGQGGSSPLFEEGVLFSGRCPKGDVLKAFFSWSQFTPSKVIFIDDRRHNLESVESALVSLGIPASLYHYVGEERFFKPLNLERVFHQMKHLMETDLWMSDEEVDAVLRKS